MELNAGSDASSWRALMAPGRRLATTVVTLSTCIFAFTEFFVVAAVPSAVVEFGQAWLLPWSFIVFLTFSIMSGAATAGLKARFGGRATMIGANAVFLAGTAWAALATDPYSLLAGRILQGLGQGLSFGVAYALIPELFPGALIAKVFGLEAIAWALAGFAAPTLAGALTQFYSWRAAFAVSLPPTLLLAGLALFLPAKGKTEEAARRGPYLQLVCLGASILALSSASLVALPVALGVVAAAGLLLLLFLWLDRRSASRILPQGAFRLDRLPGAGLWVVLLMPVTGAAGSVYFNFSLQKIMGLEPLAASLVLSLLAISWSSMAVWVAGLAREKRERIFRFGPAVLFAGYILQSFGVYFGSTPLAGLAQVICGLGFGISWGPIGQLLMETAPDGERDRVSALLPSLQSTGFAMGGAVFGIIAAFSGVGDVGAQEQIHRGLVTVFAIAAISALSGVYVMWRVTRLMR